MLYLTLAIEGVTVANFRWCDDAWDFCERKRQPVEIVLHDRSGNRKAYDVQFNTREAFMAWAAGLA